MLQEPVDSQSEIEKLRETIAQLEFALHTERFAREQDRLNAEYQNQMIRIDLDYAMNSLELERKVVRDRDFELSCSLRTITALENERRDKDFNDAAKIQELTKLRLEDSRNYKNLEKEMTETIRCLKNENEQFSMEIDNLNNGGTAVPPPCLIPSCDICTRQYSENPFKTPRILGCGHTVCEECAGLLADNKKKKNIKCPFDQKVTRMRDGARSLPKNFTIIQMMSRR